MPARFCLVVLLFPLVSCSRDLASPSPPATIATSAYSAGAENQPEARAARKLVHSGSQSVEVSDLKVAVTETTVIVQAAKGYVESSTVREDDEADLKLRVPPNHLNFTLDEIAKLGKETHRRLSVDDATKQYIDLEAELTNLRALRSRLRSLLAEAKNVKEALEVEKELTRVQTRIDSLQSQLATLKSQISYSNVSLTLERKHIPGPLGIAGKAVALGVKKLFVLN